MIAGTATAAVDAVTGCWLIVLEGEHDIATTPLLERASAERPAGRDRIVVDLTAATFIDCSVISWLLRTRSAQEERDGALDVVVGPEARSVHRLFDVVGMDGVLDRFATRSAATAPLADSTNP